MSSLIAQSAQLAAIPPLTSEGASAFQYKTSGSISTGALTIANRIGHRRTLLDVFFEPETVGIFLQIQVGDKVYTRLPTTLGDFTHLQAAPKGVGFVRHEGIKWRGRGLLWWLSQIMPLDYPTATQDESIVITPQVVLTGYGALPAAFTVSALYADQDAGDVTTKTVAGGTFNPRRLFLNDMTNTLAQPTTGKNNLDLAIQPVGLNGIADNVKQIAGLKLTGYAFLYDASALGTTTGVNANGKPTNLHILDVDTEVETVENQAGIQIDRDLGNQLACDYGAEWMHLLKDPYVFHQNRNFRFQVDTAQKAGTGVNYAAQTQYFGILGIREPEGA